MEPKGRSGSVILAAAIGLCLYCLIVTVLAGDLGFEGDDWWIFSWPYWHGFPSSLWVYARESLRPVEGVYWITLFELFGFNKVAFHLFSLLLLAGAAVLMGAGLLKAFPGRHFFVIAAIFSAFFLPTVSSLTYVVTTDNSRLSALLFWGAVLAFQRWSERSGSWAGLAAPALLYLAAFLTYESTSLLILAVPLLVLPILQRRGGGRLDRRIVIRLATGIFISMALVAVLRLFFMHGGAVSQRHILPPWELVLSYLALLPWYLVAPFSDVTRDPGAWILGAGVALWMALLVVYFKDVSPGIKRPGGAMRFQWSRLYAGILGVAILLLGILPYLMAGYGSVTPTLAETAKVKWGLLPHGSASWFNFNWSSRIYSSGTFGLAILIAALCTDWKGRRMQTAAKIGAAAVIGFMVVFHAGLMTDWKEAAQIRNSLVRSLVSQVPGVQPGTNFVFLNLEYPHKRAAVFRNWGGLRELVKMLYHEPKLGAWYLYPYAWKWPNRLHHQAVVSPRGFVSRGMKMTDPAPHGSLLILNRDGERMVLLDKIQCDDGMVPTGICWAGTDALPSNPDRIIPWAEAGIDTRRSLRNASNTGLIASLNLSRIDMRLSIAGRWKHLGRKAQRSRLK